MFSLFDLNLPIAAGNVGSEINIATVEQGNIAVDSIGVLQGNGSVIGQTTGDGVDFF
ncbi:MAG: hypothetical protein OER56_16250 [Hyphomicrobiales bacterium]|nr:hypothetical protein [Hyphomicrobiales bacterium]